MTKLWFILLLLGVVGISMLFVGAKGLLTKKVNIYSGKWLVALISLCFFPNFLSSLQSFSVIPAASLISILFYPGLIAVFWFITKGYIFFGVSEEHMSEAIKAVLAKANLSYEEKLASIHLSNGSIFQIAVQAWAGTAQFKPKNAQAKEDVKTLIPLFNAYFLNSNTPVKNFTYWLYAIVGFFMLILLVLLAFSLVAANL